MNGWGDYMAVHMVKKTGVAKTAVETSEGVKETTEEAGSMITDTALANVGVSLGATVNIGDFNNIKISVSLHVPCEIGDVDETFVSVQEWCQEKMSQLHDEVVEPNKK